MTETLNRVAQNTTTTGTGTVTLGSAVAQHVALQVGNDGEVFDYVLLDANGTGFEVGRAGVYTHSGTTFTRPSGNVERSSNSDALITLTSGTHTLFLTPTASRLNTLERIRIGYIELQDTPFTATGTTTVTATIKGPSRVVVNGVELYESGDQASSGTAVSGTDLYNVYVADDGSGGMTLTVETTDPVWDSTVNYYKHSTTGVTKRHLFSIIVVSGSLEDDQFYVKLGPRTISHLGYHMSVAASDADDSTSWVQVSLTNSVPVSVTEIFIGVSIDENTASTSGIGFSDRDQGTDGWHTGQFYGRAYSESGATAYVNTSALHVTGQEFYYRTDAAAVDKAIALKRSTFKV